MSPFFYISLLILLFGVARFLIADINYISRPFLPMGKAVGKPLVSVIISSLMGKAKGDEVKEQMLKQSYENVEVVVIDEEINGIDNQLQQVTQNAKNSDYLLFIDSEVTFSPQFIESAIGFIQKTNSSALLVIPSDELVSLGERIVKPNLNLTFFSLSYHKWIRWEKFSSAQLNKVLAVKTPDFLKFISSNSSGGKRTFEAELFNFLKGTNLKTLTLLGGIQIFSKGSKSYPEAIKELEIIFDYFRRSKILLALYVIVLTFSPFLVLFCLPFPLTLLYFFSIVSARLLISRLTGQSAALNILLWPLQHVALIHITFKLVIQINKVD